MTDDLINKTIGKKEEIEIKEKETEKVQESIYEEMSFDELAFALGISETDLPKFKERYFNLQTIDEWYNEANRLFISRYTHLIDTILSITQAPKNSELSEAINLPTQTLDGLKLLIKYQDIDKANHEELGKWLNDLAKKSSQISGIAGKLDTYEDKIKDYHGLLEAKSAIEKFYKEGILEDQKILLEENEKLIKENKELANSIFKLEEEFQKTRKLVEKHVQNIRPTELSKT